MAKRAYFVTSCCFQDEKVIKEKRIMALKGRCKQQKYALDAAKLDIQRLKKTIKTLEVGSFSHRHTDLAGYFLKIRVLPEIDSLLSESRLIAEMLNTLLRVFQVF